MYNNSYQTQISIGSLKWFEQVGVVWEIVQKKVIGIKQKFVSAVLYTKVGTIVYKKIAVLEVQK